MSAQPTIFDGDRLSMADSIELTAASLREYGVRYGTWSIAYSGGKDSSTLLTVVVNLIESGRVPKPKRLFVLYGDTRMELMPLWLCAQGILKDLDRRDWITSRVVMAEMDQRFMVYMLGRGVPPPNNNTLRWCTSQIKVEPMEAALREVVDHAGGKVLMLIGVRIGESAARDHRIAMACSRNGAECGQGWYQRDLPDAICDKLSPILHWRTCLVWDWLVTGERIQNAATPTLDLIKAVRAGEITKDQAIAIARSRRRLPSHGFPTQEIAYAYGAAAEDDPAEINARTGCIGCPLATGDTALEKLICFPEWRYLTPLTALRAVYRELREPRNRLRQPPGEKRKDGTFTENQNRMGPLTMQARNWALNEILAIQYAVNAEASATGRPKIDILSSDECARIKELIAANTWPDRWTGTEPRADELYEDQYLDGSRQLLLPTINGRVQ